MNCCKCEFIYPEINEEYEIAGGIHPSDVKKLLQKNPDTQAVFLRTACLIYFQISSYSFTVRKISVYVNQSSLCIGRKRFVYTLNHNVRTLGSSGIVGRDVGKFLFSMKNTTTNGVCMYDILREKYHIQLEMAAVIYSTDCIKSPSTSSPGTIMGIPGGRNYKPKRNDNCVGQENRDSCL